MGGPQVVPLDHFAMQIAIFPTTRRGNPPELSGDFRGGSSVECARVNCSATKHERMRWGRLLGSWLPLACWIGLATVCKAGVQDVNKAAGSLIFSDENLWDDQGDAAAARCGLTKESETSIDTVYRTYPGGYSTAFGAGVRSIQMSAANGLVTGISLTFSNQGDGGGEGASLEKSVRNDKEILTESLTGLFGRGTPCSIGSGARREAGTRWDWGVHSFVLVYRTGSYVALRIMPVEKANSRGATRIRDSQIRDAISGRVFRRGNGDVVIGGLPMVDQGDKGYCIPAVWEMALRSMGVEADMYLLAAEMGSSGRGGTDLGRALAVGREVAEEGGRSMSQIRMEGKVGEVSKWIDRGIPLIWGLRCSEQFIRGGLERSAARRGMTDPARWKAEYAPAIKPGDLTRTPGFGHVCLIVGYNSRTGEIAIADSWGREHTERWHSEDEIRAVGFGEFFAFDF